jgi:hypothetical protein
MSVSRRGIPVSDQGFSDQPGAVTLVGGIRSPEPDQNHPVNHAMHQSFIDKDPINVF